jgi:spermidine synthase
VITFFQKFVSFFSPVILWQGEGTNHKHLEVAVRNGHLQLSVPDAIYSNDVNYPPFVEAWKHLHTHNVNNGQVALVLGFGLGSVTAIADKKYNLREIHFVGVDNEEVALDTARKYKSSIYRGPWELINADVMEYLNELVGHTAASGLMPKQVALVFVDLFNGAEMPQMVSTNEFWDRVIKVMDRGAKVAVNYMSNNGAHQIEFERIVGQYFEEINRIACGKNYCYILGRPTYIREQ